MEPHSAPRGSTTKSKTQAVLIPARGSSRDDYDTDPIIVPAYHNGTALQPEGQVDIVPAAAAPTQKPLKSSTHTFFIYFYMGVNTTHTTTRNNTVLH